MWGGKPGKLIIRTTGTPIRAEQMVSVLISPILILLKEPATVDSPINWDQMTEFMNEHVKMYKSILASYNSIICFQFFIHFIQDYPRWGWTTFQFGS